eukprot:g5337.t1
MPLSSNIAKQIQKSKLLKIELKPILGSVPNVNIYGNSTNPSPVKKKKRRKPPTPKHQHAGVCICPACERNRRLGKHNLKPKPPPSSNQNNSKKEGSSKGRRFKGKNGRNICDPTTNQLETIIGGKKVVKTVENVTEDDIEMFALEYPRIKQINTLRTQIMSSTKACNRIHPGNNRGRVTLNSMQKEEVKKQRKRDNFFNSQINTEEEARHLTVLKEYQNIRKIRRMKANERIFNDYGQAIDLEIVLNSEGRYICNKIEDDDDSNNNGMTMKAKQKIGKDAEDKQNKNHLWHSLISNNRLDIIKYLYSHGEIDMTYDRGGGETLMYVSAKHGRLDIMKWLYEHGAEADVSRANSEGETPMFVSAVGGYLDIMKYLYNHGAQADINRTNKKGLNPTQGAKDLLKKLRDGSLSNVKGVNKLMREGSSSIQNLKKQIMNGTSKAINIHTKGLNPSTEFPEVNGKTKAKIEGYFTQMGGSSEPKLKALSGGSSPLSKTKAIKGFPLGSETSSNKSTSWGK